MKWTRCHIYMCIRKRTRLAIFSRWPAGLDSMVLGETEITGQIKTAYEAARAANLTGRIINGAFQRAFQVVKAIRTKTQIGRGATSVGSVAVQLAEKILGGDFHDKTVMIIGAGKMGEACVRHIAKKGIGSIIVANRSLEHAQELAREFGGRAVNYMDEGLAAMCGADIVVSSTGCPETILDMEDVQVVMRQRPHRPLFLIDIAVPRDIAAEVATSRQRFSLQHRPPGTAGGRKRQAARAGIVPLPGDHRGTHGGVDGQAERGGRKTRRGAGPNRNGLGLPKYNGRLCEMILTL